MARVRAWFGLTQAQLAFYLGISPPLLRDAESGRRSLTHPVSVALGPLLYQMPLPEVVAADAYPGLGVPLPAATSPPDAADLDFRRRECLHRAAGLLAQAEALANRAHTAARWAAVLPALLPPEPGTAPPDTPAGRALVLALAQAADPTDPARDVDHARWLGGWLRRRARPLSAAEAALAAVLGP